MEFQSIRLKWRGLSLLYLALLLHLIVYVTVLNRGKSTSFRLLALAGIGAAAGVFGVTLWLTPVRLERLQRLFGRVALLGLLAGLVALFVFGAEIRPEWFYAQMGLTLALTIALAYVTFQSGPLEMAHLRRWILGGLLVLIVLSAVRIGGLGVYPPVHSVDEGWTLSWAVSYNQTGELGDPLMLREQDKSLPRFYIPLALWIRMVGVGLWEARLFTFLLSLILVGFSAWAALNLYGPTTAFFTAAALCCSAILAYAARIRHDVGLGLSIALSLWLYSEALKRAQRGGHFAASLHFSAGLMMGWSAFSHYNATGLAVMMVISLYGPLFVSRLKQGRRWTDIGVWYYIAGGILGALMVFIIQVLPVMQSSQGFRETRFPPTVGRYFRNVWDYITYIYAFSRIEFFLIIIALGAALWRRRSTDWTIALGAILALFILGYIANVTIDYYLVPLTPFYGILVGSLFGEGLSRTRQPAVFRRDVLAVAALCLVINLGMTLVEPLRYIMHGNPVRPVPPPAAQWVLDHVDTSATVVGEHSYYLWLNDYHFLSPQLPTFQPSQHKLTRFKGMTSEEVWDQVDVDVFMVDYGVSTAPLLVPLVDSGYFESRGYKVVLQTATVAVYQKGAMASP